MLKGLANAIRFLSIDQVKAANSGHLGMPLGMADVLTVLFRNFLVFDPKRPCWPNRDRFVLSGGHGSAALYSLLYLTGYEKMSLAELKNFRKIGSKASGHPEYDPSCGIETTTGPLGEGIGAAVGMAIEERILNARLGDDCINHYVYVCAGDGDLMEGISHEACALAGHLSLGHLILLFDDNGITIDGETGISSDENVLQRFESYGWHTQSADGHNEKSISDAIEAAKKDPRPSIIACKTKIGYGTPRENSPKAHAGALTDEEIRATKKKLNCDCAPFEIPEYIEKTWKVIGSRHRESSEKWYNTQRCKYDNFDFDAPTNIKKIFKNLKKEYFVSRPYAATRAISKRIINEITKASKSIVSGSCDLGSSVGCFVSEMKALAPDDFSGNYIHYGIREHAMGAIINGIVAGQKIRAFGGTFLAFSDYMRPAIRLSALMNIPSIFLFSHDSIGVGEDGPTHQPVEQIASLRAIPNLNVFRPADAMETLECWECALQSSSPSAIILSRQELLSVRFSGNTNLCEKGGYLLYDDSSEINRRRVTLIATGSEVGLALEVKKILNDKDISANVVSIPCFELFDKQPENYRDQLLGDSLRVGIEAAVEFGWRKYLRENDLFFGVNSFGKSGNCSENYKFFGLTAANISEKICTHLEKNS